MKPEKTHLPSNSLLVGTSFDYIDSFCTQFQAPKVELNSITICRAFFNSSSLWIKKLFYLRNRIVSVFGLKTGKAHGQNSLKEFNAEIGDRLGFFKLFDKRSNEIILGEDDKHLNFRISLLWETTAPAWNMITISTAVHYKNRFGKIYFWIIKPFHKIIVVSMLKKVVEALKKADEE